MVINDIPNFKLHWLGWETEIYRLAQLGWNFFTDVDHYRLTYNLAIQNNRYNIIGYVQNIDMSLIQSLRNDYARGLSWDTPTGKKHWFPSLTVQYLNFKNAIQIVEMSNDAHRFSKVDEVYIEPRRDSCVNLTDLLPGQEQKESRIIVPEYTIPELMNMLKEKQRPMQDEIRKAQKRDKHVEKPVAQIISIT
jgi:hypothetical protein